MHTFPACRCERTLTLTKISSRSTFQNCTTTSNCMTSHLSSTSSNGKQTDMICLRIFVLGVFFLNQLVSSSFYRIFTLFAKALSLDVASRVWDVFARDGEEFLFRTALGESHTITVLTQKRDARIQPQHKGYILEI